MSYILKALRLSEEERAKGDVPRLTTRHRRSHQPRRKVWPWIVVAAVAVNLLIVFLAMWPTQITSTTNGMELDRVRAPRAEAPPQGQAGQEPLSLVESAPRLSDPRLQDIDGFPPPDEISGELDVTAALDGGAETIQEARLDDQAGLNWLEREEESGPPEVGETAPAKPVPKPAPASPVYKNLSAAEFTEQALMDWAEDAILDGGGLGEDEAVQIALAEPSEPLPEEQLAPEPIVDLYGDIPQLWQLPHLIRSQVPEVALSVHVYAPEDASRFVIINRKRYREGDLVNGRIRLEAIIPSGVVLDHDGHRFKLSSQ